MKPYIDDQEWYLCVINKDCHITMTTTHRIQLQNYQPVDSIVEQV